MEKRILSDGTVALLFAPPRGRSEWIIIDKPEVSVVYSNAAKRVIANSQDERNVALQEIAVNSSRRWTL